MAHNPAMSLLAIFVFATAERYATTAVGQTGSPADGTALARQVLDDSRPEADRKRIIADNPQLATPLLKALVADMPAADSKEEYRRIPWIWRVTVAAGKRNHVVELKPIVDFCVPQMTEPLRDWQAVVLGGGVINGIGLSGGWPDEQIRAIVAGNPDLVQRWARVLKEAAVMADNQKVFKGTRYDALRILGVDSWNHRGAQLLRYLVKGVDDELQQGAIGGLSDMHSPCVAPAILSGFAHYDPENRGFALKALLRDRDRTFVLLEAVEAGTVKAADLGAERLAVLINNPDPSIRERSRRLLIDNVD
ncbi:MAG TPA: hypothetical protein VEI07_02750 [Planctomycetaceae bacterium]|nr:hypothetical protein [Planctomycetaceae bacterium]